MLHTFFFLLSFLMDYHAISDAIRGGYTLGVTNACLVGIAVVWPGFRGWMAACKHSISIPGCVE